MHLNAAKLESLARRRWGSSPTITWAMWDPASFSCMRHLKVPKCSSLKHSSLPCCDLKATADRLHQRQTLTVLDSYTHFQEEAPSPLLESDMNFASTQEGQLGIKLKGWGSRQQGCWKDGESIDWGGERDGADRCMWWERGGRERVREGRWCVTDETVRGKERKAKRTGEKNKEGWRRGH